jgi:tetratricopeptide (TPR) repeat protein
MRWIALIVALSPLTAGAQGLEKARNLAAAGRYAEARQMARRALELDPHRQDALQLYVVTSCRLGERETAASVMDRLDPRSRDLARAVCAEPPRSRTRAPLSNHVPTYSGPPGAKPPRPSRAAIRGKLVRPLPTLPAGSPPPAQKSATLWRVAFWSAVTATTASFASFFAFGVRAGQLRNDRDDALRDYQRTHPGDDVWTSSDDVCAEASNVPDADDVRGICTRGANANLVSLVSLGVGVGLAIATGYFYYRGYVSKRPDRGTPVALEPAFSSSGGGLAVSVGF